MKLHNAYSLPNIIREPNQGKHMKCEKCEMRIRLYPRNVNGREHYNPGTDRIILKWVLKKQGLSG
jgi:hypothetical protein